MSELQSPANIGLLLNDKQLNSITQAVVGLNRDQLTWVSGYLAGLAVSQAPLQHAAEAAQSETAVSLTILYGSQTGNAKGVAQRAQEFVTAAGITCNLVSMAEYKVRQLKQETHLAVVVSTHGEGEPPDDAIELHEFLASKKAPKLNNLSFSVVGLGDSSYEHFCQTGKDFEQRLTALGAKAIVARVDCDVDYDQVVQTWYQDLVKAMQKTQSTNVATTASIAVAGTSSTVASSYNKQSPFTAEVIGVQKITGRDSIKDIRHIEISLEDSGIQYLPGDTLGVWFSNAPALVEELIGLLALSSDEQVEVAGKTVTLFAALSDHLELTLSYPTFVKQYQAASQCDELAALLADKAALRDYLNTRQIIDIVRDYLRQISAQQLVDALRPLTPRLYSIASAQSEVEDEVHLTIAHVDYEAFGSRHQGGASGFLCERVQEGDKVRVYIEPNNNFRLPEQDETPVIMIGPGTGIAPFRSFLQERDARGATGKNWLFFGNPHFTQDFLYQTEIQSYVKSGLLSNVSLAFSRDQADKIYVQHRLLEQGEEVFAWLQSGAHIYVCGDAGHMAKDVEQALLTIIQQFGEKSEADAKRYLLELRKAKRYQKDVY